MEVERGSVKLELSNELTKEAHFQSMEAHKKDQPYITKKHGASSSSSSSKEVSIFAFPWSLEVSDWYHDDFFGETDVDCKLLPSLRRVGEDRAAKVNAAFFRKFKDLLKDSTNFKTEVEEAVKKGKSILFTGHSYGGAIASFATLWMLDEYVKKRGIKLTIGCVTFGSPLIGDRTLSHAVRREKWAGHFTHFVMERDIVPRIMLAPNISIQQHLPTILKFFEQKFKPRIKNKFFKKLRPEKPNDQEQMVVEDDKVVVELFENVMMNALSVASHVAFELMEPTNSLMEKLSVDFVKVSPYRPSGFYVFCTSPCQRIVVENPNAVLQFLFYFLQLTDENQNLAEFAMKSITESFSYEEDLKNGLEMENLVNLKALNDYLLTTNGTAGDASNEAVFKLSASARCCLMAAEEAEKRKEENETQINKSMRKYAQPEDKKMKPDRDKLKIIEDMLDALRDYKQKQKQGDYYNAFKLQNERDDFFVNVDRLKLAKIFDEIVEMVMRDDLPDEFEGREEWVVVGTEFRRLFEPLDIGNYYRHSKGDGYIPYMNVRPKRYKFTQRWYEHANGMEFQRLSETNFVAQIEELIKEAEKVKEEMKSVQKRVNKWNSDQNIQKQDVYWGESLLSLLEGKFR